MDSWQLTPEMRFLDNNLQVKFNIYYNKYRDIVFRRTTAPEGEPLFVNAGALLTYGVEPEVIYQLGDAQLRLVANHYQVESVQGYPGDDNGIYNIPRSQYNLIFDYRLTDQWLYQLSVKYIGARQSPINVAQANEPVVDPYPDSGVVFQSVNHHLPSVYLVGANVQWQADSIPLSLSLTVKNALDKTWQQGGSVVHPYRQTGRWYKLGIEYRFK
jgi:outer membrane receptor protein involved in Fe transport